MGLAAECPHYWYDAISEDPSAAVWLNQTIIMGDCIAKPLSGVYSSKVSSTSSSGALSSSGILSTGTPSTTRTSSDLIKQDTFLFYNLKYMVKLLLRVHGLSSQFSREHSIFRDN
jgi:hypothetical protein